MIRKLNFDDLKLPWIAKLRYAMTCLAVPCHARPSKEQLLESKMCLPWSALQSNASPHLGLQSNADIIVFLVYLGVPCKAAPRPAPQRNAKPSIESITYNNQVIRFHF